MSTEPRCSDQGAGPTEAEAHEDQTCGSLTFEDLLLRFSPEEWGIMNEDQKRLYCEVMMSTFADVLSLGIPLSRASLLSGMEPQGEYLGCFLGDITTAQVTMMEIQPVPTPWSCTESSEGAPSELRLSIRAPTPLAGPRAPGSHLPAMYDSDVKDLFPLAVQQGMSIRKRRQYAFESHAREFSFVLPHGGTETIRRERGQGPLVTSHTFQGPDQALTGSVLVPRQGTHSHRGRKASDSSQTFKCEHCGIVFVNKGKFLQHRRMHYELKCRQCGKAFYSQNSLFQHKKFHTGERPYVCADCGTSFSRKTVLTAHKCHIGDNSCRCDECGRLLSSQSYLVIHKRVHSRERPYVCSECGKTFISKYDLTHHKKGHNRGTRVSRKNPSMETPASSNREVTME
uniref:putative zinc finger protein 730 n=1 Tax=Jaculus jaculus TaxID=51337 RepID=UPI001E1B0353|nr:putative zinc finger protein 730 [Jaculus jaculus]XP_044995781.1 putative zinc finger protein 730 [Jaculus jaculus]